MSFPLRVKKHAKDRDYIRSSTKNRVRTGRTIIEASCIIEHLQCTIPGRPFWSYSPILEQPPD